MKLAFLDRFSKNPQIPNFMKIRPEGAELFHAGGGRTDRYDDAYSSLFAISRKRPINVCGFRFEYVDKVPSVVRF
jgi:hypothetical protein